MNVVLYCTDNNNFNTKSYSSDGKCYLSCAPAALESVRVRQIRISFDKNFSKKKTCDLYCNAIVRPGPEKYSYTSVFLAMRISQK